MKKNCSVWLLTLLLLLGGQGLAQATYYHFEDYGDSDIPFGGTGGYTSYTWIFDLNAKDSLYLWVIDSIPLTNEGLNWLPEEGQLKGNIGVSDELHRAYLTMKFTKVNDAGDAEIIDFTLDIALGVTLNSLSTPTIDNWTLYQGGLPNQIIPTDNALLDVQNAPGTLNVISYLKVDHYLSVTIDSVSGGFNVEKMNLAGCYAVVPEPGTLILMGVGLMGMAVLMRKKG